jgi:DedD protein
MELKQRIIGLIVLLSLGVILVPLIFDSETVIKPDAATATQATLPTPKLSVASPAVKPSQAATQAQTQPATRPTIQPGKYGISAEKILEHQSQSMAYTESEVQELEDQEDEESSIAEMDAENVKQHSKNSKHSAKMNLADSSSGPWMIQLGVFSELANAKQLVNNLKSKGFKAFVEQDKKNHHVHRVFIGPEQDRDEADKMVAQLDLKHHIKSIVTRYKR